jgi:hypothetical protein
MIDKDKVLCKTNSVQSKHNLYYKRIPYAIDQIKCIIQTPNVSDNNWVSDYDGEWNMYIYVFHLRYLSCV